MCLGICPDDYDNHRPQRQRRDERALPPRYERSPRQEATRAAQNYGWPRDHSMSSSYNYGQPGNRDSHVEPELMEAFVSLPGSDLRRVYDPERSRQSSTRDQYYRQPSQYQYQYQYPNQPSHAAISEHSRLKSVPGGRVEVHRDNLHRYGSMHGSVHRVVREQPRTSETMKMKPYRHQQTSRGIRRGSVDSNGVSDISSDDDDDDDNDNDNDRRRLAYTPSPLAQRGNDLYSRTGYGYGRRGAF
ncbi:hypothetical protein F4813DRAFT_229847 [Daldinia decipiens]|uniref:uncharacterized protein n=1 Tax=Daldinia decipiens TaxID=326647 RepID=UPI0020C49E08|nr:uncharacterized protein F4813DRAFT_229847 [Daldinia decipiens]KAI1661453.1 hypothetical protein F4813DRAFT_229847 [Daldinia decipiens]